MLHHCGRAGGQDEGLPGSNLPVGKPGQGEGLLLLRLLYKVLLLELLLLLLCLLLLSLLVLLEVT